MLNVNGFTGNRSAVNTEKSENKKSGSLTSRKNEAIKKGAEGKKDGNPRSRDIADFSGISQMPQSAGIYDKIRVNSANNAADGKTAELSDTAKDYLAKLKEKYGNMDFIIADYSTDEEADALLAKGKGEYNVLISPSLLEKMAADEATAQKYEGMIDESVASIEDVKGELGEDADMVEKFGVTIDADGNLSLRAKLIEGLVDKDGNNTVKGNTVQELLDRLNETKGSQADKIAKMREEKAEKAKNTEKSGKTEKTTVDTSEADDEIEKLNNNKQEILNKLKGADGSQKEELMRKLQEIERELAHKDNDTYRKAHSKHS